MRGGVAAFDRGRAGVVIESEGPLPFVDAQTSVQPHAESVVPASRISS